MKTLQLEKMSEKELLIQQIMLQQRIEQRLRHLGKPTLHSLGFMTNDAFMEMLGIGRATAAKLRNEGAIPFTRKGHLILYRIKDVIAFLNKDFQRK